MAAGSADTLLVRAYGRSISTSPRARGQRQAHRRRLLVESSRRVYDAYATDDSTTIAKKIEGTLTCCINTANEAGRSCSYMAFRRRGRRHPDARSILQ